MTLRLEQLGDATRPAFERLLVHAWGQNWNPELARDLVRWRYGDRPSGGGTWLVFDGDRCVALLDSFLRPYLLDGRSILVRETCDWFCLPEYRPLGLGIGLMRQMMKYPEPLLSIGGSQATLALLPRLRWAPLPDVQKYVLPVKARSFAGTLLRRKWPDHEALARAIPRFIPCRPPRRTPPPPGGLAKVSEWQPGTAPPLPLPQRPGLVQLLPEADLDWIARMPRGLAEPLGLVFSLDGETVGFVLSQLEPAASGSDACIVHLQLSQETQSLADWVIAETTCNLARRGAGIIRCSAASPLKITALQRAGFVLRKPHPSYWWSSGGAATPGSLDAGYLRADDALPFPALRGRRLAERSEGLSSLAG